MDTWSTNKNSFVSEDEYAYFFNFHWYFVAVKYPTKPTAKKTGAP